ncbi:TatD family hydrolase [Taylorella equigenitalis]|uniref:TatD family hydrolase n=1 Tax=Taylorella equigenitalis TaxID=29575 RepID=UPI0023B10804|nr:TatD family hydrolase [Taylorella equigenitalis]WED99736.1 TatD family hydrolase [Taylorella equigenitalis]WEE01214.1 TatD family hydrolase [Taylorella equigenitalis]WFD77751.1 TatD family hydrolase [Taylorella equigenitalis]WFD79229.1 TatD family hydrolase [Taylorella equigenitalis]WFD80705.1 TatD family hydrolase [Taylorella equigenitalis]
MFVDSHCHLDFPELIQDLDDILDRMKRNSVEHALCINVNKPDWDNVLNLVEKHANLSASVGVHPDYEDTEEPSIEDLVQYTRHPKVVAIGECGLDYYRLSEPLEWQRDRFRIHIRAAIEAGVPLVIHTRQAPKDTIKILKEEGAERCGGVMHCFTEDIDMARESLNLGFYISMSGIVTFKNATQVHEVAKFVPLDKLLIETDSPYLAPVPYRGKRNDPSYVMHVAEKIAELKEISLDEVGDQTTKNFYNLFSKIKQIS